LNSYYEYYKYSRPEMPTNVEILNDITNVKFVTYEQYNSEMKQKNPNFTPLQAPRETNKHQISHHIRSIAENSNIIENVKFLPDKTSILGYKPSRRIIDINASRILMAGLNPIILCPNNEAADTDRNRSVIAAVDNYEKKINNMLTDEEIRQLTKEYAEFNYKTHNKRKVYDENGYFQYENLEFKEPEDMMREVIEDEDRDEYEVKTSEQNLVEFFQAEHDQPYLPNALVNLTDIIYYLSKQDLYDVAQHMASGTIMVGTAHVPKYLDTQEHFIQFGTKIEGKMQIVPNQATDKDTALASECTMFMKMAGNDTMYVHKLDFMEYLHANMEEDFITCATHNDFILKMIPIERYDCGATYYIRFKILKIEQPKDTDLILPSYMGPEITAALRESARRLDQNQSPFMIINEVRDTLHYDQRIKDIAMNVVKIYKTKKPTKKAPNCIPYEQMLPKEVFLKDGKYYFTKKVSTKNAINVIRLAVEDTTQYIAAIKEVVDPILVNKLVNKICMMTTFDKLSLKSLITYVNQQAPKYSIPQQVIPLLAEVLRQSLQAEAQMDALLQSDLVTTLNQIKGGEFKIEQYELPKITSYQKIVKALKHLFYHEKPINEQRASTSAQNFQSCPPRV